VSDLFSTISPKNVIRKIVVAVSNPLVGNADLCELLDTKLSSLPMPDAPIVEFVIGSDAYEAVRPYFPLLTSRNLVRSLLLYVDRSPSETIGIASPR
jgi:hypothetical protein